MDQATVFNFYKYVVIRVFTYNNNKCTIARKHYKFFLEIDLYAYLYCYSYNIFIFGCIIIQVNQNLSSYLFCLLLIITFSIIIERIRLVI